MYDTAGTGFCSCKSPLNRWRGRRSHSAKSLVRGLIELFGYYPSKRGSVAPRKDRLARRAPESHFARP